MARKPFAAASHLYSVSVDQLMLNQESSFPCSRCCYPVRFVFAAQFGPWSFGPQHGFARITRWTLERAPERLANGDVEALFSLMDNDFTRSMWNYPFRITYRLIIREKELHFHVGVYNPSKDLTFSFNLLLHTYLKVPDVRKCQITGLHGCMFVDKTRDGPVYQEGRDAVTVNEWTDRVYQHTPQEHIITNVVSGRKMRLQKYNFPDTGEWMGGGNACGHAMRYECVSCFCSGVESVARAGPRHGRLR